LPKRGAATGRPWRPRAPTKNREIAIRFDRALHRFDVRINGFSDKIAGLDGQIAGITDTIVIAMNTRFAALETGIEERGKSMDAQVTAVRQAIGTNRFLITIVLTIVTLTLAAIAATPIIREFWPVQPGP
jgi:hypothetical protein